MTQVQALQACHRTDLQGADSIVCKVQRFQVGQPVQPRLRGCRDRQLIEWQVQLTELAERLNCLGQRGQAIGAEIECSQPWKSTQEIIDLHGRKSAATEDQAAHMRKDPVPKRG
ncbi:hypothetical protein D3C73_1311500 [compost metagenome]